MVPMLESIGLAYYYVGLQSNCLNQIWAQSGMTGRWTISRNLQKHSFPTKFMFSPRKSTRRQKSCDETAFGHRLAPTIILSHNSGQFCSFHKFLQIIGTGSIPQLISPLTYTLNRVRSGLSRRHQKFSLGNWCIPMRSWESTLSNDVQFYEPWPFRFWARGRCIFRCILATIYHSADSTMAYFSHWIKKTEKVTQIGWNFQHLYFQ